LALDLAAIEAKACERRLEELCNMQDRAIQALKNALEATQLALNLIERNRQEQGYKQQIQWQQGLQYQVYNEPYKMYPGQIIQYPEGFWSNQYAGNNPQPSSQEKYYYAGTAADPAALYPPKADSLQGLKIEVDWNIKDNDVKQDIPPY
jgi:hypothetical protein